MNVAIVDTLGSPYDGSTPFKRGLGGSESAVVFMSRELVKLGISVDVFCDCSSLDASPGEYDGVRYFDVKEATSWHPGFYNVVINSRSTKPIADKLVHGEKQILWMHDTFCEGDELLESMVVNGQIDEVWTLSDWHTTYISTCTHGHRRMPEVLKRKIWQTRNGVHLWQEADLRKKEKNHFVFNASATKGMETLLKDVWPRLYHAAQQNIHLTVIGGYYALKTLDAQYDKTLRLKEEYDGKNNVRFTGYISQEEVADIMSHAAFMLYPQSLPETYGISTVEALAYGTPVISGRFGAMEETAVEDACYLMDYPVDSNQLYTFNRPAHLEAFHNLALSAWQNEYLWQQKCNAALKVRDVCTWDKVALQWKQHLYKITGRYLPLNEYHSAQRINHRTREIFNRRWSDPNESAYFPEYENPIHVIVPFYNASQYLSKCVESIKSQNYENYRVWLVDDASTDGGVKLELDWRWHTDIRKENVGALANQVMALEDHVLWNPGYDPIVVLIDGDDALVNDPNVFKKINRLYHEGAQFTYGSMWSMADNIPLVAQDYPKEVIDGGTFKDHKFAWGIPYTHLRTFRRRLFNRVDHSDLRDGSGAYYKAGGDSALFYALIEKCDGKGIKAVRDILYLYNDLNPINDYKVNSDEQTRNANEILASKTTNLSTKQKDSKATTKKILIAVPTAKDIHPETYKSIYNLTIPDGYEADFQYFFGYRVDQVRNLIADWAIKGYDYLFAVDHDMGFKPDALVRLLSHNAHIATGVYCQRLPDKQLELYRWGKRLTLEDFKSDSMRVDSCGFGCALVSSWALKNIGYPQFEYHPALKMEDTISEDTDFCQKAAKLGFEIIADRNVMCDHYGEAVFRPT